MKEEESICHDEVAENGLGSCVHVSKEWLCSPITKSLRICRSRNDSLSTLSSQMEECIEEHLMFLAAHKRLAVQVIWCVLSGTLQWFMLCRLHIPSEWRPIDIGM
jgi:hypothetical protein